LCSFLSVFSILRPFPLFFLSISTPSFIHPSPIFKGGQGREPPLPYPIVLNG
jgi:hypothetical protein